ncbi:hypothetical protein [Micromonospora eburnea]|uniref:hypothetical protein n=1 Tax=Micromonospora eburnea TaxID=227316 RepID=UPI001FC938DC|nr:hypothetical protein [Micromonospora eburnea]
MQPAQLLLCEVEVGQHLRLELLEPAAGDDQNVHLAQQVAEELRHPTIDLGLGDSQGVVQVERHHSKIIHQVPPCLAGRPELAGYRR